MHIPFIEFGGTGSTLHIAHANAYTAGSYRLLGQQLTTQHRVLAMRQRPTWPNSDPSQLERWSDLVPDLISFLDQENLPEVIGVGHSMGGVVTMFAAIQHPERFKAIVLIDPVFLRPEYSALLWNAAGEPTGAMPPIAQIAQRRQDSWPSREAAFAHLRPKRVFAGISDEALADFIEDGLADAKEGVRLAYPKAWEARVYARAPYEVWDCLPQVRVPMLIIYAEHSDVLNDELIDRVKTLNPGTTAVKVADSSHLVPMEKPVEVAQIILDWLG